jgi:hypothetical protein
MGEHDAVQAPLLQLSPSSQSLLLEHALPHWVPKESVHAKFSPLDPPQLETAHAAKRDATATLAAAARRRVAEVARSEGCLGRRM